MSQQISPEVALRVLEVFTARVGVKIKQEDRFETVNDMVMAVNMAFVQLIDASETAPQLIAEKLIDLSATCVIAVASMAAGAEVQTQLTERTQTDPVLETQLTDAEQRALVIMKERMNRMRAAAGGLIL